MQFGEDEFFEVEFGEADLFPHFGAAAREDGDAHEDGDVPYDVNDDSGDDIWNDDHIPDLLSNDDRYEEEEGRHFNFGPDDIIALGKTFNNAEEFKYAVFKYSLKTQYDIKFYKSSSDRLGAHCTKHEEEKCPWRVYCSFERARNKLLVKVFNETHICVRSGYTKLLKSGTIGQLFEERLRTNPKIKSQEMVDEIKREYNMIVSLEQCRRAKSVLSARRKAGHEAHFARLWDYQEEVIKSNGGSTMEVETIPGPVPGSMQRFYHLYVCFEALKSSWRQSCRPIIGLDAAFMKWDIKGKMLAAVGRDGDNRIFPIAWAVVEVEDNPNWLWFVQLLKNDLGLDDGSNCTIISDKHRVSLCYIYF